MYFDTIQPLYSFEDKNDTDMLQCWQPFFENKDNYDIAKGKIC